MNTDTTSRTFGACSPPKPWTCCRQTSHDVPAEHTVTLAELLTRHALPGYRPPAVSRAALVHGHCHHKSILGTDADMQLLALMGMDCNMLPSGCCGMAGAFGFERAKYELSVAIGERVLLPATRSADATTLIVTDGSVVASK